MFIISRIEIKKSLKNLNNLQKIYKKKVNQSIANFSYITLCDIINKEKEQRFKDIFNRTLEEQIKTLKHITRMKRKKRNK